MNLCGIKIICLQKQGTLFNSVIYITHPIHILILILFVGHETKLLDPELL